MLEEESSERDPQGNISLRLYRDFFDELSVNTCQTIESEMIKYF
jgi:hypothetical protein